MKKMEMTSLLSFWVSDFVIDNSSNYRKLSHNTIRSYGDTCRLFFCYLQEVKKIDAMTFPISKFNCEIVREFISHLEKTRNLSPVSCNQRLAMFKSLAKYLFYKKPEFASLFLEIRQMDNMKCSTKVIDYLTKDEFHEVISVINQNSSIGFRNYVLFVLMFNTGLRVSETANLRICDIHFEESNPYVHVLGKGNKYRECPLWKKTVELLQALIARNKVARDDYVFRGERGNPITRHGIYEIIESTMNLASKKYPHFQGRKITPHSLRHSMAMELIDNEVDINSIRGLLGHASIETTNIYTPMSVKRKAMVMEKCAVKTIDSIPAWKDDSFSVFIEKLRNL